MTFLAHESYNSYALKILVNPTSLTLALLMGFVKDVKVAGKDLIYNQGQVSNYAHIGLHTVRAIFQIT